MLIVTLITLGLLVLLLVKFRHKSNVKRRHKQNHSEHPHKYHCVSVVTETDACPDAANFGSQRFLPSDAPELPLEACKASYCHCHYKHHNDRRNEQTGQDRRHNFGLGQELFGIDGESEKRSDLRGRRASDKQSED